MNTYYGGYWVLTVLPIWVTALTLYSIKLGAIFILRDRYEGLYYQVSYSAQLGDGALIAMVLMAAGILQRGGLFPPSGWFHIGALALGAVIGVGWWLIDALDGLHLPIDQQVRHEMQWGDVYHHLVIAPLLVYLFVTLLPVIYKNGTSVEKIATVCMILFWVSLCIYDARNGRLDQRNYHGLGQHADALWKSLEIQKVNAHPDAKDQELREAIKEFGRR